MGSFDPPGLLRDRGRPVCGQALDMFAEQIKAAFALRESAKAQIWLKTSVK